MSQKENVKIVAFVGLAGSGKSATVRYLAELKHPKVSADTDGKIVQEVSNLVDAGQHLIFIDELHTLDGLRQLKHAFPGSVLLVSLLAHRDTREKRLGKGKDVINHEDWNAVENGDIGALTALADTTIQNDGTLTDLYEQIDELLVIND